MRMQQSVGLHGIPGSLIGFVRLILLHGSFLVPRMLPDLLPLFAIALCFSRGFLSTPFSLPVCCEVLDLGLRVFLEGRKSLGRRLSTRAHCFSHQHCMQAPSLLDFGSWISGPPKFVTGFFLEGLLPDLAVPTPVKHYRSLAPRLARLRLFADLVRVVLHLWSHGCPAFLVSASIECPGLAAVKKAALVTSYHDGVEIVSNFQGPVPFLFGFTS